MTTQKPKQQITKTADISKTKPIENKAWFRSSFMSCGQETDRAYSTATKGPTGRLV